MNLTDITPKEPVWMAAFRRAWWFHFEAQYDLRYSLSEDRLQFRWKPDGLGGNWYHMDKTTRQNYIDQGNTDRLARRAVPPPDLVEILP